MKKISKLISLLTMVTVLGGCSAGEKNVENNPKQSSDKTLIVYSPQGDEKRGEWIKERAKKDLGIELEFLKGGGGELTDRLIAEKENPQADIALGLGQMSMEKLKDESIIKPYVPKWANGLPEEFKEKQGYYHSFWQTPIVIAYNTNFMKQENAPKSWEDLADSKFSNTFTIGDIKSQVTRTYLSGILWKYIDKNTGEISNDGWNKLKDIYKNSNKAQDGVDEWGRMAEGKTPIVLSWLGGITSNTNKNNIPVEYVNPEEGTPIVAEAIALVKDSKKEDLSKEFIDWFGSSKIMSNYANEFDQAPAHPDAIKLCKDEVKKYATMFKVQKIDWSIVSKNINKWLEKIQIEIEN